MPIIVDTFTDEVIRLLAEGGVGVLRTDTLYGIVARADNEQAVERVYALKGRTPSKSPIVLIEGPDQLFEPYSEGILRRLANLWPGRNSVILPAAGPPWIIRDNASIAYRVPDDKDLQELLRRTGALIAPSANPEGAPPAMNINEARAYFGNEVDFYVDGGEVTDPTPSNIFRLQAEGFEKLR